MNFAIETMSPDDWPIVRSIYQEGLATGKATFETTIPGWKNWNDHHFQKCRLVVKNKGQIVGWAALSPVSPRRAYAGVAEVSIYLAAGARGKGIGKILLQALIIESERAGIWTLQAGIFPENVASIALHKACGFREIGRRERVGQLSGVWRDVVLLERRSRVVGV